MNDRSIRPSLTPSTVWNGPTGALGRMLHFTRPEVAFSKSAHNGVSMLAVIGCAGDTHELALSVTCAAAMPAVSAAATASAIRMMNSMVEPSSVDRSIGASHRPVARALSETTGARSLPYRATAGQRQRYARAIRPSRTPSAPPPRRRAAPAGRPPGWRAGTRAGRRARQTGPRSDPRARSRARHRSRRDRRCWGRFSYEKRLAQRGFRRRCRRVRQQRRNIEIGPDEREGVGLGLEHGGELAFRVADAAGAAPEEPEREPGRLDAGELRELVTARGLVQDADERRADLPGELDEVSTRTARKRDRDILYRPAGAGDGGRVGIRIRDRQPTGVDERARKRVLPSEADHRAAQQPLGGRKGREEAFGAGRDFEILPGGGVALGVVRVEQALRREALPDERQLPAEVERVLDAGVAAARAEGADDVCRVADEEHAPVAEVVEKGGAGRIGAHPHQPELAVPEVRAQPRFGHVPAAHVLGIAVGGHLVVYPPNHLPHQLLPDAAVLVERRLDPGPALGHELLLEADVGDAPAVGAARAVGLEPEAVADRAVHAGRVDDPFSFP